MFGELEKLLSKSDGTTQMVDKCIACVEKSSGVLVFGAGVGGAKLYELLSARDLDSKIVAWIDNNELKWEKTYMNDSLEIIKADEVTEKYGTECTIIVASSAYDLIVNQMSRLGYPKEKVVLYNFAFMDLDYTDASFIWDNIKNFERAYQRLCDDKSRKIFVDLLNYKITKDEKYLDMMHEYVDDEYYQYFDKEIYDKIDGEALLDVGAYIGDTLEVYETLYDDLHNIKYYGFEADPVVYARLNEVVKNKYSEKQVYLYNLAAWNEDTVLWFEENAGSSRMKTNDTSAKNSIKAMPLDKVLTNDEITIIKMDIEGAELQALNGLKAVIAKNKPIFAICVYHLRDDFFKVTDFIEEQLPGEYKFYFRQYRYTPTETVCYAVPRHRWIEGG